MAKNPPRFSLANDVSWARAALESALATSAGTNLLDPDAPFGDYELFEPLEAGATATVYRAHQISLDRTVALKKMHGTCLGSKEGVQRFKFGAEAAAALRHPNIARIHQVGEHGGVPFIAMELLEGGDLGKALTRFVGAPVAAVKLMAKVADAVQYAHEHGVLHRDLKPANIVLDEADEPYVVDFGFAKRLDERALSSKQSILVGTMYYVSPEQVVAARSLTFASDIYGLGAILYELLTGKPPLYDLPFTELVAHLSSPAAVPAPRTLDPSIDAELDLICSKCLEKDPRRRYASAAQLARDLKSWLACKPISIRPDGYFARFARWCRAHPTFATLIAGAACVLTATTRVALSTTRELEQALLSHVLHANADAAQARAGQVLFQLRELSAPVARCAGDVRIEGLFAKSDGPISAARADRLLVECGAKTLFDSVALVDRAGNERARLPRRTSTPAREEIVRRDYYQGARRLAESGARSIHVGRVQRSEDGDGARRLSLSTPVFDEDNQWLGIVNVTVDLSAFLEGLQLADTGRQIAVLAGVREREPGDAASVDDSGTMVLLHKQQEEAQASESESPWLKLLKRIKEEAVGRDQLGVAPRTLEDTPQTAPVTIFKQRWLAAFAPVGHTGFGVIVQTQYENALREPLQALVRLLGWSGAVFLLGALFVLALARTLGRRARLGRA
jgi:serine/threonine-protein kinase